MTEDRTRTNGDRGFSLAPGYVDVPWLKTAAVVNWINAESPLKGATKGIAATKTN